MKILQNLFYRLYQLMIKVGNKDVAEYYAVLLMGLCIGLNIISIFSFVFVFIGESIVLNTSKPIIVTEVLGLAFIFYLFFVKGDKHLNIAASYEKETKKQKNRGIAFAIIYIVASITILLFNFYLMMKKNRGEI